MPEMWPERRDGSEFLALVRLGWAQGVGLGQDGEQHALRTVDGPGHRLIWRNTHKPSHVVSPRLVLVDGEADDQAPEDDDSDAEDDAGEYGQEYVFSSTVTLQPLPHVHTRRGTSASTVAAVETFHTV